MAIIGGLQKNTVIDYPGKIACTVFFIGCPFRCPFCHNPELVLPEQTKNQPIILEKDFFDFLKERQGLLDGVVLCGGEPTIYSDLSDFIIKVKEMDFLVKLDTNGSNPKMLKQLFEANLIDYVAMDIKSCFSKYNGASGVKVNMEDIKQSIEMIKNLGIDYEFRTTVVPGIHTKQDIIQLAKEISPAKKYFLQNFQPGKTIDPEYEKIRPFSDEDILEMKQAVQHLFQTCNTR